MDEKKDIQWHPGFVAALQLALQDEKEWLEFISEYELSKKPLRIDVFVKKSNEETTHNHIGELFRKYNVIEYKSPDDKLGVDAFFKAIAYACLFKASGSRENEYNADEITITLVRHRKPTQLFKYLRENGYKVEEKYEGIFYISGQTLFPTQVIVSKAVQGVENVALRVLNTDVALKDYMDFLDAMEQMSDKTKEELGEAVLQVLTEANMKSVLRWKEERNVCLAMEKVMAPELEARELKGRILTYAEMGVSIEEIAEKTSLSVEEIEDILAQD